MGLVNLAPTVASLHRDDGKLGQGDGTLDGSGYLLGTLNIKPNVTIVVSNSDKSLKSGLLASSMKSWNFKHGRVVTLGRKCTSEAIVCLLFGRAHTGRQRRDCYGFCDTCAGVTMEENLGYEAKS